MPAFWKTVVDTSFTSLFWKHACTLYLPRLFYLGEISVGSQIKTYAHDSVVDSVSIVGLCVILHIVGIERHTPAHA